MPGPGGSAKRPERLLVVDDEPLVLTAVARVLRSRYDVRTLSCPVEALRCLTAGESFSVVLSDVIMPAMNGFELARRVAKTRPDLVGRIILMTGSLVAGDTSPPMARKASEQSEFPVIAKPIDFDALRALIARICSEQP